MMLLGITYNNLLGGIATFVFSLVIGNFFISRILDTYYTGYEEGRQRHKWRAASVGLVERSLYFVAALADAPEFIAIWLAFKIAGQWDRWSADRDIEVISLGRPEDFSRAMFGGFSIGNGLSVAFGFIGGIIAKMVFDGNWETGLAIVIAMSLGCILLWLYICIQVQRQDRAITKP